jgi:anthraniloyl-CoA monooxygenase
MSTVVVEMDEDTWRNAGFGGPTAGGRRPGEIDEDQLNLLTEIFADHLSGHKLVSNNSRWGTFDVVRNRRWSDGNTVLLGDAAHTAHFTVGSGTKMALEDAVALAHALRDNDDRDTAFAAYEQARRGPVERTQRWAEPSMRWWETYGRRLHMPPAQFGMHFVTRTGAMSYLGLRRRCPDRVDDAEAAYLREAGAEPGPAVRNAVGAPLSLGSLRLPNRLLTVAPEAGLPPASGPGLTLVRDVSSGDLVPYGPGAGAAGEDAVRFAELECPADPEWSQAGDDLVERARRLRAGGVTGVLLLDRGGRGADTGWNATLDHASRIRTETGSAVAIRVPGDWAFDLARDTETDSWPTRIHQALISGRIDLIAVPFTEKGPH